MNPSKATGGGLAKAQHEMLKRYEHMGVTNASWGSLATFRCLVRKGLLSRSYGLGIVEVEITAAGRAALSKARASGAEVDHG